MTDYPAHDAFTLLDGQWAAAVSKATNDVNQARIAINYINFGPANDDNHREFRAIDDALIEVRDRISRLVYANYREGLATAWDAAKAEEIAANMVDDFLADLTTVGDVNPHREGLA